jgi:hypothetical protein
MTLDEFARRWLSGSDRAAPSRSPEAAARETRPGLTETAVATFRERPARPARIVRLGRRLVRWSLATAAASALFAAGAAVILKLGPYVQDYAALYLVE